MSNLPKYIPPPYPKSLHSLYLHPKIHKLNNTGHSIVVSHYSVTQRIPDFVDDIIQPIVQSLPSYIKFCNHFPTIFRSSTPLFSPISCLLSLYNNIPILNATLLLKSSYPNIHTLPALQHITSYPSLSSSLLSTTSPLTLHCFQVQGKSQWKQVGPFYANLSMGSPEEDFLNSEYSDPVLWLRFIHIFLLWTHGYVFFSFSLSASTVATLSDLTEKSPLPMSPFLILIFFLRCQTSLPLSTQTYEPPTIPPLFKVLSPSIKGSIPFSQVICGRRIFNHNTNFSTFTSDLTSTFECHG